MLSIDVNPYKKLMRNCFFFYQKLVACHIICCVLCAMMLLNLNLVVINLDEFLQEFLKDRTKVQQLVQLFDPLVRAVDGIAGERVSMRVRK